MIPVCIRVRLGWAHHLKCGHTTVTRGRPSTDGGWISCRACQGQRKILRSERTTKDVP
jgi:hypothetical protein